MPIDIRTLSAFDPRVATPELNLEVGDKPAISKVLRDGKEVVAPLVNDRLVSDLIDRLPPIGRAFLPRVLSQTVSAGAFVAKGTSVDLVLLLPKDITVGLLQGTHLDLATRPITDLLPVLNDAAVQAILASHDNPDTLTAEDKTTLQEKASQFELGIQVQETTPGKGTGNLFTALKGAMAFR